VARPKSEDKKQALLEAATAAFAQSGVAASTSAIARSAGVAEGTLFRYFATKDELLNELYLSIKSGLVKAMVAGLTPNEKRPKENARNIWNSYIDWSIRHPMEHKAIRRMALSERITDETNPRKEMFPELNEMCQLSVNRSFSATPTAPLATPCFCRWRKPLSNLPATIRSAPRADRPRF
jgi:AcrR family transcriptional regulator